jgi:putative sigma-54 modulation protein
MQVNINAVHFKADKQLERFITGKLEKVGKFNENVIGSEVTLKVGNTDKPENKITEIRLKIGGNDLISSKQCKTFEEATDLAVEALQKQLKKIKDKNNNKGYKKNILGNIKNILVNRKNIEEIEEEDIE